MCMLLETQAQRDDLGVRLFYDANQKYVEFKANVNSAMSPILRMPEQGQAKILTLLEQTRNIFTENYGALPTCDAARCGLPHTMSLERRKAVTFGLLVSSGMPV